MRGKKLVLLLLTAALMLSAAGCNKEEKQTNGEVPTLIYLVPGDPQADEALVEEELSKITVEKIGAKIDLQYIDWSAWKQKTNLIMATNEYFDISSAYAMQIPELVSNGCVLGLSELMDKEAKNLKKELPEYFWDAASVDGEIYCIPNQQIEANNVGLAVRKDLAEKYNLDFDSVETIMDMEQFWQNIRDNEKGIYPFKMSSADYFVEDAMGDSYVYPGEGSTYHTTLVRIYADSLKAVATPDFYGLKEGAKLAYECGEKGYFRADRATATDDSADMAAGKYASFTNWYKPGVEAELKNQTGYDYLCKMISKTYITESTPLSTKTIVSAYTKYPVESIKFIELLNTDKEVYNLVAFGIENKHYTWADDEHISVDTNSGYCPNSSWVFGNVFNAYTQVGQDADVWEKTKELNDSAVVSPIMGISFDTSDITLELAQCDKIQRLYLVSKINRAIDNPDEYWEQYRQELKNAGIDKVIECYQSQIDEFLSKKGE